MRSRFVMVYMSIVRILVKGILALVGRMEIEGRENIPAQGPYIVVSNHLSKTDAALILLALPKQRMRVFAASKWRGHPIFGPILGLSGAIWVRRGEVDRDALRAATRALNSGEILGMAPEGTRSRTGAMQKARNGPAYIASRAQVPLLPVGITNSDLFQANILRLRRTTFRLTIGRPFHLPALGHRARGQELEAYTELVMAHIADQLPEHYRGFYATSITLQAITSGQDPWPAACQTAGMNLGAARE